MFSVQEGSEVGRLPHGRGKFGVLVWQHPLTLKPPIKIYKKALKSEKARITYMVPQYHSCPQLCDFTSIFSSPLHGWTVGLGIQNLRSTHGLIHYTSQILVHGHYSSRMMKNDIALIKLSKPVDISGNAKYQKPNV